MGAGCQEAACCCSEELSPRLVVLLVARSGLAAAGDDTAGKPLRRWQGGKVGLFVACAAEKSSRPALGSELFHLVPRAPEKLLAFPLSNIKVALWLRQVEREREGNAAFE